MSNRIYNVTLLCVYKHTRRTYYGNAEFLCIMPGISIAKIRGRQKRRDFLLCKNHDAFGCPLDRLVIRESIAYTILYMYVIEVYRHEST